MPTNKWIADCLIFYAIFLPGVFLPFVYAYFRYESPGRTKKETAAGVPEILEQKQAEIELKTSELELQNALTLLAPSDQEKEEFAKLLGKPIRTATTDS